MTNRRRGGMELLRWRVIEGGGSGRRRGGKGRKTRLQRQEKNSGFDAGDGICVSTSRHEQSSPRRQRVGREGGLTEIWGTERCRSVQEPAEIEPNDPVRDVSNEPSWLPLFFDGDCIRLAGQVMRGGLLAAYFGGRAED